VLEHGLEPRLECVVRGHLSLPVLEKAGSGQDKELRAAAREQGAHSLGPSGHGVPPVGCELGCNHVTVARCRYDTTARANVHLNLFPGPDQGQ